MLLYVWLRHTKLLTDLIFETLLTRKNNDKLLYNFARGKKKTEHLVQIKKPLFSLKILESRLLASDTHILSRYKATIRKVKDDGARERWDRI